MKRTVASGKRRGGVKNGKITLCERNASSECFLDVNLSNAKSNCQSKFGFMLLWFILWINMCKGKLIAGTIEMAGTFIVVD